VIPLVTASEQGKAQTENLVKLIFNPNCSLPNLIFYIFGSQLKNCFSIGKFFKFFNAGKQPKDPWKGTA